MTTMRRLAYAVFGVACTHLVFGAIVRISGSGMGCGPHWPKCYGYWFPPMSRPDLVIEVTHRYLASILLLSLIALVAAAFRRRAEPGVGGQGGVLRMATLAMALGFGAALLGAVTVKLGNSAPATVAHWTVAMSLVAAVTATVIRTGGLGGAAALLGGASAKTRRGTLAGAGMALVAVVMGGLTAKVQGGPIACLAFPLCGANPAVPRGAVHVQSTHRVIAVLLVLHLVGLFFALRKRREAAVVRRAASIALGLAVLQLLIAGAMIGMHLPPALRSLHEATGVSIWIATFALAYLARIASRDAGGDRAALVVALPPETPLDPVARSAASVRAAAVARPVLASATIPVVSSPTATADATAHPLAESRASAPSRTPVASMVVVPGFASAYLPTPSMPVVEEAPVSPLPEPDGRVARRVGADVVELPEATGHALPSVIGATLDFHRIGSSAAVCLAKHEERQARDAELALELAEPPVAVAVTDVSEIDYADIVDVEMLEVMGDAGVEATTAAVTAVSAMVVGAAAVDVAEIGLRVVEVAVADTSVVEAVVDSPVDVTMVDTAAIEAAAIDAALVAAPAIDALVVEAVGDVGDVGDVCDVGVAAVRGEVDEVDLESRGAPPTEESTIDSADERHPATARRTIFDVAEEDRADDVDDLYNLRGLEQEDDAEDDAERVATLDEEFSTLAVALEAMGALDVATGDEPAEAPAVAPVALVAPVAPVARPRDTLATLFALRRPMMTHSVAVIAARGADL